MTQYLIHTLDQQGEIRAAELLVKVGSKGDLARDLAYRLYKPVRSQKLDTGGYSL